MVRNLLPLNLLGGSCHSVLRCPLFGIQDNSLQHLHRLKPVLLAQCVTFLHHELLDPLIITQLGKMRVVSDSRQILVLEEVPQVNLMGDDDRDWLLRILTRVNADV